MMNKMLRFVLTISLLTLSTSARAGLAGLLSSQHQDWGFIQSVGGIKVDLKKKSLQVSCNVSGLETITTKPSLVNSAMGVRKLKCSRVGTTIRVSVVTSVLEKGMSPKCGSADLNSYPAGSYSVVYLNPDGTTHPLGKVVLR